MRIMRLGSLFAFSALLFFFISPIQVQQFPGFHSTDTRLAGSSHSDAVLGYAGFYSIQFGRCVLN